MELPVAKPILTPKDGDVEELLGLAQCRTNQSTRTPAGIRAARIVASAGSLSSVVRCSVTYLALICLFSFPMFHCPLSRNTAQKPDRCCRIHVERSIPGPSVNGFLPRTASPCMLGEHARSSIA
jgi:hypothetical protein